MLSILIATKEFIYQLKPTGADPYLLSAGAGIGAVITFALGGLDKMIYALLALAIIDYTIGTIAALRTHQWDSSVGFKGLLKKAVMFAVVALCHLIDACVSTELLRQMAIGAYALNEAGSIIENIDRAGYGHIIPHFLRQMLARLNDELKEKVEEGELK